MQQAASRSLLAFKGRCMDVKFDIANSNYKPLEKIGTGTDRIIRNSYGFLYFLSSFSG